MPIIEVKNYSFSYGNAKRVLNNLNFTVQAGTITAVIGLSGCGKTTLCHCLCGIIPNSIEGEVEGSIRINEQDIKGNRLSKLACTVGLVMQNPDDQIVCSTVEDELAFAPENLSIAPAEIQNRVDDTLRLLEIESLRLENPNKLSGGQKHMVAIGSVLTLNPEILLLDEPMSHLDEAGKTLIKDTLIRLKWSGKTIMVVEHDYKSMTFADSWLVMSDGNIIGYDTPESIRKEHTDDTESGKYNIFI